LKPSYRRTQEIIFFEVMNKRNNLEKKLKKRKKRDLEKDKIRFFMKKKNV